MIMAEIWKQTKERKLPFQNISNRLVGWFDLLSEKKPKTNHQPTTTIVHLTSLYPWIGIMHGGKTGGIYLQSREWRGQKECEEHNESAGY